MNKVLIVIPARGGSKGIPRKNIKLMNGKPLICYSIDIARAITDDLDICVTTEDDEIISVVNNYGLQVPFKRPETLASDTATTNDVLLHAIDFYESKGLFYDIIVLLQPTSPLRQSHHIEEAIALFHKDIDMVVSVKKSHTVSLICQENVNGYLELSINKEAVRRQDLDFYYEYNGSIYVINIESLKSKGISAFTRKIKYLMAPEYSVDLDSPLDWDITEFLMGRYT